MVRGLGDVAKHENVIGFIGFDTRFYRNWASFSENFENFLSTLLVKQCNRTSERLWTVRVE